MQIKERGFSVGMIDFFDWTHTKSTPSGEVYVNLKAQSYVVHDYANFSYLKLKD